jgi:DNA-directed RNA polymerase alpha subunit
MDDLTPSQLANLIDNLNADPILVAKALGIDKSEATKKIARAGRFGSPRIAKPELPISLDDDIESLDLGIRVFQSLKKANIDKVDKLLFYSMSEIQTKTGLNEHFIKQLIGDMMIADLAPKGWEPFLD